MPEVRAPITSIRFFADIEAVRNRYIHVRGSRLPVRSDPMLGRATVVDLHLSCHCGAQPASWCEGSRRLNSNGVIHPDCTRTRARLAA